MQQYSMVISYIHEITCFVRILILYRAYANAIELLPESALFWHDLAVGYLYLGQVGNCHYCNLIGQSTVT